LDQLHWAQAIALSAGHLIVGDALGNDPGGTEGTGSVHVMRLPGHAQEVQRLGPGNDPGAEFGATLAIDGHLLAVGAPDGNTRGQGAGKIYVFERSGDDGDFARVGRIDPIAIIPGSAFGSSIALAAGTIVVGQPKAGNGRVEIYQRRGKGITHLTTIQSPSLQSQGWFGHVVAFDGRRLAVGEPGGPRRRGRVWRYELIAGRVQLLGEWAPDDLLDNEWFGYAIALGSGWLAAGAPSMTDNSHYGRVLLLDW